MDNQTDLTLYKPSADINKLFGVDETLPDNELAFAALDNLVKARKTQDALFLVIGKMLKLYKDRKLYKFQDFENFEQFLASEEVSFSREKAYLYIRIYEMFVEKFKLNSDDITKLGVARLMMLVPILKEVADREEAIKKIEEMGGSTLRFNDFVKKVKDQTNKDGKPSVYWSEEASKWIVNFFSDTTNLIDMGKWEDRKEEING